MMERERVVEWFEHEMTEYPGTEYRRHLSMVKDALFGDRLPKPAKGST